MKTTDSVMREKKYLEGKELREYLMKKFDSKCFWCEKPVKIYPEIFGRDLKKGEYMPNDAATIEHMMDGVSGYKEPDPDGKYKVLACYYCNHLRSRQLSKVIAQKSAWLVKQEVDKVKAKYSHSLAEARREEREKIKRYLSYAECEQPGCDDAEYYYHLTKSDYMVLFEGAERISLTGDNPESEGK